ncbi:lysophospholipid acyltransferase family protein [Flavobacteriaceae bacterium S356]|uniref:Lysophospholipid acyltransferase family protein n=1 Tax=Asprobacillus argus TaxID=3076534 RepID=A0ABU3LE19_9FLAO|nr:lysophospholipid acyltransferase family protein [Flavobacteriaceae bacterium S356]
MQFLVFIIAYPFIFLLSILPMRVLYIFSDFFYVIFYHIIGYRKKVVYDNLKTAFPNKTEKELKTIQKKFFRHFTDIFMESVKAFTITQKTIQKRYTYKNPEVVNDIVKKGKNIALVGAHQANWEWSTSLPLVLDITVFGAYTKLANKYFEKVVKDSRMKFGVIGYKTSETIKSMKKNYDNGVRGLYLLLSDQSPQVHKTHYWSEFFGVKVPIHTGAEMLAKKFDLVVINYVSKKIKRGHYQVEFELITETPKEFENYQITDKYLEITERNIQAQPEYYLWSHKRFKHRDKVPKEWQ